MAKAGAKFKMTSVILAVLLLIWLTPAFAAEDSKAADALISGTENPVLSSGYDGYYKTVCDFPRPAEPIELTNENLTAVENDAHTLQSFDGFDGLVLGGEASWCEYSFDVPIEGTYSIYIRYYQLEDTGRDILFGLDIDGIVPFSEAETIALPRLWKDKTDEKGISVKHDKAGNELRPAQIEAPKWTEETLFDPLGMYEEPYLFYLEEGQHTVRLKISREKMAVKCISFKNSPLLQSYGEYIKQYSGSDAVEGDIVRHEAEAAAEKNSPMLYMTYDRSDALTQPNHPNAICMNTIGQSTWKKTGQSITWRVKVPAEGLYTPAFRARQDVNQDMISYRTLSVNGEIPFAEAKDIEFSYNSDWYVKVLGDEAPIQIYLKDGDELTLTCSPGKLTGALRNVREAVLNLSGIYRKIIIITGVSPDIYRDYNLVDEIPDLLEMLKEERNRLSSAAEKVIEVTGKSNSQTSAIQQTAKTLDMFIETPYLITEKLGTFQGSIESLSALLLTFGEQPLELDCLYFIPQGQKIPVGRAGMLKSFLFSIRKFIGSFSNDYQSINPSGGNTEDINVWISSGRDQTQIISMMITDSFTPKTNIPVRLSLVDTGETLIQATMAGKGPDVALAIPSENVINLSMRGALADLSKAEYGIERMKERFPESAWIRFSYNSGIYGVPETQGLFMLFYRTDIFSELKLVPPDTWKDFYNVLHKLQNSNMNAGIPETNSASPGVSGSIGIFQSFLFQKGGTYYNEELTKTMFDTPEAFEAFEEWAALYSKYGVARGIDFFNRFRTGDIPIGVADYSMFNQLTAAAPELRGLWKMALYPGTKRADGTVDRSVSSGGTGAMLMTSAEKRGAAQDAWQFLNWWAETETQSRYGSELEAVMGVAARYAPAGYETLKNIGWTEDELSLLEEQARWIKNVQPVPGDYMLSRALTNALRATLDNGAEARRALSAYDRDINAEITRKRKEFKLG